MGLRLGIPGKRILTIAVPVVFVLFTAAIWRARPERMGRVLLPLWVRTIPDVPYGPYPENLVDLMQPRWSLAHVRPGVLVFHGGGWQSGDRNEMVYRVCRRYLSRGFLVANAEYRCGAIPIAAADAAAALQWFTSNAKAYGVDPQRIVVTGVSAGGHLALLSAFRSSAHPAAVVNFYGPANLELLLARPAIRAVLPGKDPEQSARQMSPETYIRRGLPPVFSVHGTADEVIPPEQTVALTQAMRSVGGDASALFITGGKHGFSAVQEEIAYHAVFQFLRRHGIAFR